jgi:hypothetical protein
MTIQEKLARLKGLKKDLNVLGASVISETEDDFIDYNKDQMSEGKRSDGQRIGVYAWPSYERFKTQKFPRSGGWVNLELKGDFKSSMRVRTTNNKWQVYSTDSKAKKLQDKYGLDIYGLTAENMLEYRSKFFMPLFMNRVRMYLNG